MPGTHLTLGCILVFFSLRHFSAHRSQFGCVIPDLDKNRNPFNCRLSSVKSSPKAPGAEIRFLWTEREMFAKSTPFTPAGMSYHKGVWVEKEEIDRWMDRVSNSANSCAALLAHSKHNDQWTPSPHAYLISSTLSATSIHIDEGKRTRHESRYVAYKNKNKNKKSRPGVL